MQWWHIVNELDAMIIRLQTQKVQTNSIPIVVIVGVDAILIDSSNSIWFQSGLVLDMQTERIGCGFKVVVFLGHQKLANETN